VVAVSTGRTALTSFAVLLLAAAGISFLAYGLQRPHDAGTVQLGVAILAVVLLNAVIGFTQEYAAERTVQALQAMVPRVCRPASPTRSVSCGWPRRG
jgi:magnesium-transporting ATPase (P-type)